jgi:hypothetical protein
MTVSGFLSAAVNGNAHVLPKSVLNRKGRKGRKGKTFLVIARSASDEALALRTERKASSLRGAAATKQSRCERKERHVIARSTSDEAIPLRTEGRAPRDRHGASRFAMTVSKLLSGQWECPGPSKSVLNHKGHKGHKGKTFLVIARSASDEAIPLRTESRASRDRHGASRLAMTVSGFLCVAPRDDSLWILCVAPRDDSFWILLRPPRHDSFWISPRPPRLNCFLNFLCVLCVLCG